MHINCLELLAADLAMKSFLKGLRGISVLLQLDNSTAVAYINNLGGMVSPALTSLAKSLWLWAPGERYSDNSPAHTRSVQHSSRLRIEVGERSLRLEIDSGSVPENQSSSWPTGSGPVCLSTHSPITSVLQLEVGPSIGSHGCISAGLEDSERIWQSTLVSDWTCTQQDKSPGSSSNIGGTNVEGPSMVPSSP